MKGVLPMPIIPTLSSDRYTVRAITNGTDKYSIHDERDPAQPGKRIASCPDEQATIKVLHSLNKEYSIAMQLGPASLLKRKAGAA
jgi:hypothetical protein